MKRPNIVAKQRGKQGLWQLPSLLEQMTKILFSAKPALRIVGRFSMSASIFMSGANKDTKRERDDKINLQSKSRKPILAAIKLA